MRGEKGREERRAGSCGVRGEKEGEIEGERGRETGGELMGISVRHGCCDPVTASIQSRQTLQADPGCWPWRGSLGEGGERESSHRQENTHKPWKPTTETSATLLFGGKKGG